MAAVSKPEHSPTLMPYIMVRDVGKSMAFYQAAFGFAPSDELLRDDAGNITHAALKLNDCRIMIAPEGAWGSKALSPANLGGAGMQGISLYVYVADSDAHFEAAKAAGATITMPPEDMFWGDRNYGVQDPDGYNWCFAHLIKK